MIRYFMTEQIISDSADPLISNESVGPSGFSVRTELRRHIEWRTEVYVEKDTE